MSDLLRVLLALPALIVLFILPAKAQEAFVPVNTDYSFSTGQTGHQAFGINPANISLNPRAEGTLSFSLAEVNSSFKGDLIKRTFLHNQSTPTGGETPAITKDSWQPIDFLRDDVSTQTDIKWMGLAFHTANAGSFALQAKTNIVAGMRSNDFVQNTLINNQELGYYMDTLEQIIFEDGTISEADQERVLSLFNGTQIKAAMMHEFSLGYSRHIIKKKKIALYAGVSLKFLLGSHDAGLEIAGGNVRGYMTEIPYLPDSLGAMNFPNSNDANANSRFGMGFGTDLGLNLVYKEKLQLGVSVTDIGGLNWPITPFSLREVDANEVVQHIDENGNVDSDALLAGGIFYHEDGENTREQLPTKMIVGVNYAVHKWVHVYADLAAPLNDNIRNLSGPVFGAGAEVSLFGWVNLRSGFMYADNKQIVVPTYLSLMLGKKTTYEITAGTMDVLAYRKANRPGMQAAVAALRFHF